MNQMNVSRVALIVFGMTLVNLLSAVTPSVKCCNSLDKPSSTSAPNGADCFCL